MGLLLIEILYAAGDKGPLIIKTVGVSFTNPATNLDIIIDL